MAFSIRIDKEKKVHLHVLTEAEVLARTEEEIMHPIRELELPLSSADIYSAALRQGITLDGDG